MIRELLIPEPQVYATHREVVSVHDCGDGHLVIRVGAPDAETADTLSLPVHMVTALRTALEAWELDGLSERGA